MLKILFGSGRKVPWSASYLLRVKSKLESGRVRAHLYDLNDEWMNVKNDGNLLIIYISKLFAEKSCLVGKEKLQF